MAKCNTCNHTIHHTVEKCPSCGDPDPHKVPLYAKIFAAGLVLIVIVGWSAANL